MISLSHYGKMMKNAPPLHIQIKHEAYSFLILCSHILMARGSCFFVLLFSWLIKMSELSFLSVHS